MLEAIKLIGAVAGLLTTAFVIWDRWARGRPLAWVTATKLGVNPYKYIRITNPGPADVFILAVRVYHRRSTVLPKIIRLKQLWAPRRSTSMLTSFCGRAIRAIYQ
jgi:hypothetical protein